jgi:hypothetical protein
MFLFSTTFRPTVGPTYPRSHCIPRALFSGCKAAGEWSYLRQFLRLRMSGAKPLHPTYVFMACCGTTLNVGMRLDGSESRLVWNSTEQNSVLSTQTDSVHVRHVNCPSRTRSLHAYAPDIKVSFKGGSVYEWINLWEPQLEVILLNIFRSACQIVYSYS